MHKFASFSPRVQIWTLTSVNVPLWMLSYCSVKVKRELFITPAESQTCSLLIILVLMTAVSPTNKCSCPHGTTAQMKQIERNKMETRFTSQMAFMADKHQRGLIDSNCQSAFVIITASPLGTAAEAIVCLNVGVTGHNIGQRGHCQHCLLVLKPVIKNENSCEIYMHEG